MAAPGFTNRVLSSATRSSYVRPTRRVNALTLEIYAQLRDLFAALQNDDAVKVVIITGTGRGFCSGGDVHQIIGVMLERDMRGHLEF